MQKQTKKTEEPQEEQPSYKWLSIAKTAAGYVVLEAVSEGDKLVSVKVSEPDMRVGQLAKFKIAAAKEFME